MASHLCPACNRPLPPQDDTCAYCGETRPRTPAERLVRIGAAMAAGAGTVALVAVRLPAWPAPPATRLQTMLVALGIGLALLPPVFRGVAATGLGDRLCQALSRAAAGWLLAGLGASTALAVAAPHPWTPATGALAAITGLALSALPFLFAVPWTALPAGLLLGIGLAGLS